MADPFLRYKPPVIDSGTIGQLQNTFVACQIAERLVSCFNNSASVSMWLVMSLEDDFSRAPCFERVLGCFPIGLLQKEERNLFQRVLVYAVHLAFSWEALCAIGGGEWFQS